MSPDVYIEWQQKRIQEAKRERALDEVAWRRNALLAHTMYHAVHTAASRMIAVVQLAFGGKADVDFDYDALPDLDSFMPTYGDESEEEIDPYDVLPLDPNTMSREQWAAMMQDVRQWQRFQTGTGEYARH